ncbi:MAG TPA: hypothetical protein VHV49_16855 [Pseudonocardiaceae bacterium]|nr:hypothetical protein [Pseudonocardiaceae bacterium]
MLAGRIGDLIGRKRVFIGGLALFTAASAWCGLSPSQGMQVGGALGLAVLATLAASRTRTMAATGVARQVALTSGYHIAFLVASGIAAAGLVLALAVLRREPAAGPDTAEAPVADRAMQPQLR